MAVPEQVRKQSEAIAKLYDSANSETPDVNDEGRASEDPASHAAPAPAGNEPSASPEVNEQTPRNDEETYAHRYRTLQGMYNADTARLRSENQQLNERLSSLENLLSSMSTASQPGETQAAVTKLITDADLEEYGDSIDVMRRAAREETSSVAAKISELEQRIQQLQTSVVPKIDQVAYRQAASAEQVFWSEFTRLVPSWQAINSDPKFHEWLLEVEPLHGVTRQSLLENAQKNFNAERVALFFDTWRASNHGQATAQPNRTASAELQRQVSPGRGRSGGAPTQTHQDKMYSPADIKKFFEDVRRGVYTGRETERDKIERDIFAAQSEGRIVMNG
jgi:BMFP domain-containing protein YqiC